MRRRHSFVLLLAFASCQILGVSPQSYSQSSIQVSSIVAPVNQLSISDIDFRHSTTPRWLFTVNITVLGTPSLWVTMHLEAGFTLPSGENYPNTVSFSTDSFLVTGTRSVSNLDLDRSVRIADGTYRVDNQAKRRLEEIALPTGRIPAGAYMFHVDITPTGGSTQRTDFTIVLSNPSTVELIAPADGDGFVDRFPLFQWQYDGPSSRISIFEKLPGQTSLEEAASGVPHFTTTTTSTSLHFPSSGTRVLEPGKTYVWFVEGLSGATGGTTLSQKSGLRSFTVAGNSSQSLSSFLDDLARALPQYQALFDELRAQGFTTANTMNLNGRAISTSDLRQLLDNLRLHPESVTMVESE